MVLQANTSGEFYTPILLIHFNRPDITAKAIEALRPLAPKRIWILCDGARAHKQGETEKVRQVRAQLEKLPWDCEIRRLYRKENHGCFRNISTGITWFLNDCGGEGIILEDDCIADPSFFRFCTELLAKYRNDPDVMAISGSNRTNERLSHEFDYVFSYHFECWGWATWKRAWDKFDPEMLGWRNSENWKSIKKFYFSGIRKSLYWSQMFRLVQLGKRDSWAYRYFLTILNNKGKTILPSVNMVENVGFAQDATNCDDENTKLAKASTTAFPLRHPSNSDLSAPVDGWLEDNIYSKSIPVRVKWIVRKLKKWK